MSSFIEVTQAQGKAFYQRYQHAGKVVMLNLLKFKTVADYPANDPLKPNQDISGKEAYQRYMAHTLPLLDKAGSRLLFSGENGEFLIGPSDEKWDMVLLVEHASMTNFLAFASDEEYLKGKGHRTAALADSRLLPITENQHQ